MMRWYTQSEISQMDYDTRKEIAMEELLAYDIILEYLSEVRRVSIKYGFTTKQERELGEKYLSDIQDNNLISREAERKPKLRILK